MCPKSGVMRRVGRTTILTIVVLVVGTVFAVTAGVGPVNAQTTGVDSCTVLDSPGTYRLTTDIVTGETGPCIEIAADNVTFDGNGHQVRGRENTPLQRANDGIHAGGSVANPITNVTVRNVTTTGWSNGTRFTYVTEGSLTNATIRTADMNGVILETTTNTTLHDLTFRNNNEENVEDLPGAGRGLTLTANSRNNTIADVELYNNKYSMLIEGSSQDNRVRNVSSRDSTYVAYLYSSFDNHLRNITSSGNHRWVVYSERNASDNTVTNLTMDGTTVSLEPKDVAVRPVPGPGPNAPPALPNGSRGIGKYAEIGATRVDEPGTLSFSMAYASDDLRNANESTISMWRATNGTWSRVNDSQLNASANRVRASNLSFSPVSEPDNRSVFAPLAAGNASETGLRNATTTPTPTTQRATPTPTITPVETGTQTAAATTTPAATGGTGSATEPEATTGESDAPATEPETPTTTGTGPGFGPVVALVAVLVVSVLGRRVAR